MTRLLSRPCTISHRQPDGVDGAGRPVVEFVEATARCGYKATAVADRVDGGTVVTDEVTLYLEPGTDIGPGDEVTLENGPTFTVVSDPHEAWNHRAEVVHHLEVRARRRHR